SITPTSPLSLHDALPISRISDAGAETGPHPILSDRAVRHALLLATPRQRIVDTLLFGRARAGTAEIPIGWAAYGLVQDGYDPVRSEEHTSELQSRVDLVC